MKKKYSLIQWLMCLIIGLLLAACSGGSGEVDKLGGLRGIWVNRDTGEAFRMTKEGLFQRGILDDAKDVFTPTAEYIYLREDHDVVIYEVDCLDRSYDDWLKIGSDTTFQGTSVTPPEGYVEHKNPYDVDDSQIQNQRPDLDQVSSHLRGRKTSGVCGTAMDPNSGNNANPALPATSSIPIPTDTPMPTATPTKIPEFTINGLCKSLSGGTQNGMLYTPGMVMYFENGLMYAGQEGMSIEDLKFMSSQSVWNGGTPVKVIGNTISFALPNGSSIDVQRNGSHYFYNNEEYECPEGSIQPK